MLRPRRDRGAGDGRLVGVDGDDRTELAGDALDERDDPLDLVLGVDGRAAGRRRLAADVEDVGPVRQQIPRELQLGLERRRAGRRR